MSDYGVFEASSTDGYEEDQRQRQATRDLGRAIQAAREGFGDFLGAATDKQDYKDRLALVMNDLMQKVADAGVMPVPGVMRKVKAALRPEFRTAGGFSDGVAFEEAQSVVWDLASSGVELRSWDQVVSKFPDSLRDQAEANKEDIIDILRSKGVWKDASRKQAGKCPKCDGMGRETYEKENGSLSTQTCTECGGTGKVASRKQAGLSVGDEVYWYGGGDDVDTSASGVIVELPAVDPDGRVHSDMAAVEWADDGYEIVEINNLLNAEYYNIGQGYSKALGSRKQADVNWYDQNGRQEAHFAGGEHITVFPDGKWEVSTGAFLDSGQAPSVEQAKAESLEALSLLAFGSRKSAGVYEDMLDFTGGHSGHVSFQDYKEFRENFLKDPLSEDEIAELKSKGVETTASRKTADDYVKGDALNFINHLQNGGYRMPKDAGYPGEGGQMDDELYDYTNGDQTRMAELIRFLQENWDYYAYGASRTAGAGDWEQIYDGAGEWRCKRNPRLTIMEEDRGYFLFDNISLVGETNTLEQAMELAESHYEGSRKHSVWIDEFQGEPGYYFGYDLSEFRTGSRRTASGWKEEYDGTWYIRLPGDVVGFLSPSDDPEVSGTYRASAEVDRPDDSRMLLNVFGVSLEEGKRLVEQAAAQVSASRTASHHLAFFDGIDLPETQHRVAGWDWDDHLNGFLAAEAAREFTCSCGDSIPAPGYVDCRCGKRWNCYTISANGSQKMIAREVPVRDGVVMANRRTAAGTGWETPPVDLGTLSDEELREFVFNVQHAIDSGANIGTIMENKKSHFRDELVRRGWRVDGMGYPYKE